MRRTVQQVPEAAASAQGRPGGGAGRAGMLCSREPGPGTAMAAFVAHPSVRIKGTEHSYNPVLCQDEQCGATSKGKHMHCPFCSVSESYQDPVILRAHYRVKHVDKGLDFAGLKILRCCNHCEIVGTIKGEKKFKGAHWHCYRCRNGFNRRDEAVKHFKTHFRNPHTTFQIQITQDVNNRHYYAHSAEAHPKSYGRLHITSGTNVDVMSIGSVLAQAVLTTGSPTFHTDKSTDVFSCHSVKDSSLTSGITVEGEENVCMTSSSATVATSSSSSSSLTTHHTLVLMDPDGDNENIIFEDGTSSVTGQASESPDQSLLEKQLIELHQQNQRLKDDKEDTERKLRAEILQLKEHIASIVQANMRMAEELNRYRTSEDLEKKVEQMEWQHRELLQMQVAALRKEFSQKDERLVNGKSNHSEDSGLEDQGLVATTSTHNLLANTTTSSEHGNNMHLAAPSRLIATQDVTPAQMGISFLEPSKNSPDAGLEELEIVTVQLNTDQPISNLETNSSPTSMPFFPVPEINKHQEVLSSPVAPSLGDKRLAEHVLVREAKPKLQRTV
ncbi:uncharacterized protein LOC115480831 isoform X2 [Microcaecilia unicolor]|uniref:Uncharacterized protein LOC115480831 isoform X2 n=1 Tax=Microcaecilia unicolor TaxID=1415580 RepID=A0A6P7ZH11_9AMPH|nr:uncharacterized protein LOC115480831 isoform X2 [Microcaecilia unicolor]